MEDEEYIYERNFIDGIKLEEVTGGTRYKGKVWLEIARQIYCENGKDGFRDIGHFQSGAPFLYGESERISISHTDGCLVVATLKTPDDTNLAVFSEKAALGIDVERADRDKVMKIRERFLNEKELETVADSVEANIMAWTAKEALLKASLNPAIDWRDDIQILSLPSADAQGRGSIMVDGREVTLALLLRRSGPYIITVARPLP